MRTSNIILTLLAAVLATVVIVTISSSAVGGSVGGDIELSGVRAERSYDAMPLRHLRVGGPIRVLLAAGAPGLRIEADEALLDALADADPDPATLSIEVPRGVRLSADEIVAHVTTPTLEEISLSGRVYLSSEGVLPFARNAINLSGSCSVDLEYADARQLDLGASGSADVDLRGRTRALVAGFSGSGDLDAAGLSAAIVRINSSGSASAVVRADSLLEVRSSGSGDVRYHGQPRVSFTNSGSGKLRAI